MKPIDCPPYAPILMEATRAIGYSMEAAVADIIDNSLTANASEVNIWFLPYEDPYIAIIDNGDGINERNLTEIMRYGSSSPSDKRKDNDLGRYGLGLKTASLSQCRCLTVVSKIENNIEARRWDLDYINSTGSWSLLKLDSEEINKLPLIEKLKEQKTGTYVLWNRLDKIKVGSITLEQALDDKIEIVREHLELIFHRFLSGDGMDKIKMNINGNRLVPFDPFFTPKSNIVMDDEKIELPGRIGKVVIRPFILPHPSNMSKQELEKYGGKYGLRRLQGFYIYRNKRLLTWATWFRLIKMDEFTKLARVRVDIPNCLDDLWTLDIKKSTAYPPEIVKTRLKQIIGTISNGSKRTWKFRSRKEQDDNVTHIWQRMETREGIRYFINQDYPTLELINEHLDDEGKKILIKYLETVQNNLPINTLHNDIHNEVKISQDQIVIERKRVCEMARDLMIKAQKDRMLDKTFENFKIVEPFNEYLDEIKHIYEEVRGNGRQY